jgi:GNAT superfamily N-acetyltransferase
MSAEAVEFRDAIPQEIGAMALVIARANAQRDGEPIPTGVDDAQILDLQERMSRPNAWTYVAVNEGGLVGVALGYPRANEGAPSRTVDTEYLSLLMVEPDSWGKGIASRLLDLVAERARLAGRSYLTLRTRDESNGRARSVYEHKGFSLTGVTKDSQYGRQVEYQLDL